MSKPALNTSKFKDIVTGTWADSSPRSGFWTVDNSGIRGLFRPDRTRRSTELWLDINRNGRLDRKDRLVGLATTGDNTGGRGTWNWSTTAGRGDYFSRDGQDAGDVKLKDTSFLKLLPTNKESTSRAIQGTWKTIIQNRPDIAIETNPQNQKSALYFGIASSGAGRTINYNGYKDSNRNGTYDRADQFVGIGTVTSLDGVVYNSGTFSTNGSLYEGFVNDKLVATGDGFDAWFS